MASNKVIDLAMNASGDGYKLINLEGGGAPVPPTPPGPDYSKMYLTIEVLTGGTIYLYANGAGDVFYRTLEYSKNGSEWVSVTSSNSGSGTKMCDVDEGDVVMFRGNNNNMYQNVNYGTNFRFTSGFRFNVYGNVMSILYKDDFSTRKSFTENKEYQFHSLFNSTGVIDASNLILPATTLANHCYSNMFEACTSLATAPALPATALTSYCYYYMFKGCTSLNYIKCLATSISATQAHTNWVQGVSPTGTFVKKAGVSWSSGASGIPSGWTVIEE